MKLVVFSALAPSDTGGGLLLGRLVLPSGSECLLWNPYVWDTQKWRET